MKWQPDQWHPQTLVQMGFLMAILASVPLLTKARSTFLEKVDQVLVPQVPDSGIKCMECGPCVNPFVNPCSQHPPPPPPPPPPSPPTFPSTDQYCCRLAPPPPPRLTYTKSDLEDMGNLNDTYSSNAGVIIVIVILVLVGLGVLLWRCAGPCKRFLEKICFL